MKLLHIIPTLSIGGAEHMLYKLSGALALDPNVDQSVICLRAPDFFSAKISDLGIPITHLNMKGSIPQPKDVIALRRAIKAIAPDVIHGWMYHGAMAALISGSSAVKVCGIRHSLHDIVQEKWSTQAVIKLLSLWSKRFAAITYNSQLAQSQHEDIGFSSQAAFFIPNGFESELFRPDTRRRKAARAMLGLSEAETVILHAARLHPMKDHQSMIDAANRLDANIKVVFAGRGVDRSNAQFADLDPSRYLCLGERGDIAELMQAADLFCLTSAWGEGFPNVIGEALASGLICIASNVGDCKAILNDIGFIFEAGNSDALYNHILAFLSLSPDQRQNMRARGRSVAQTSYALCAVTDQHLSLYNELL